MKSKCCYFSYPDFMTKSHITKAKHSILALFAGTNNAFLVLEIKMWRYRCKYKFTWLCVGLRWQKVGFQPRGSTS